MHTCFSRKIRRFTVFLTQSGCDSAAGVLPCKIDRRLLKTRQTRAFSSVGVAVRCERGRCEAPPLSPADFSPLGVYPCFSFSRQNTQGGTSAVFAPTVAHAFWRVHSRSRLEKRTRGVLRAHGAATGTQGTEGTQETHTVVSPSLTALASPEEKKEISSSRCPLLR